MAVGYAIASLERNSSGIVNVVTAEPHGFLAGDKVRLFNVLGGSAIPFMAGNPYTVGTVTETGGPGVSRRFNYTQTGGTVAADMLTSIAISSGTPFAVSTNRLTIVTSSPHNLTTQPSVRIRGVTGASEITTRINDIHRADKIEIVNSTTLIVTLIRGFQNWAPLGVPLNFSAATLEYVPTGAVVALDDGINTVNAGRIGGIGITSSGSLGATKFWRLKSEAQMVQGLMGLALQSKGVDYPFLRLFDVTNFSQLTRAATKSRISISTSATTLRGALDALVEAYQGIDGKQRRYYVNLDGVLVYEIADDAKPPTATAPYKIVTASIGSPNTSTAAASVNPYDLSIEWDQDTTKRALFTTATRTGAPIADLIKFDSPDALGTAYTRPGAPYFDEILDYPNNADDRLVTRQDAARAYFVERYAPILRGSFELRGGGTATWNNLGFSSGYAAITTPGSSTITVPDEQLTPARRTLNTITFTTFPFAHNLSVGMPVTISGITDGSSATSASGTAYNGSFTVASVDSAYVFTYTIPAGGGAGTVGYSFGNGAVSVGPSFVLSGTAPTQLVTATYPYRHGIFNGATTTISGLTGASGTAANGTVTATVLSDYVFTYPAPSSGTNGTATGTASVSSITLVPRWAPGQWVDVSAPTIGSSAMYRVEEIRWRFEPGGYQQAISVTFNRRPTKTITRILKERV